MFLSLIGLAALGILAIINLVAIVWALVTIASAKRDPGYKVIWAVLVLILGIIGALLYYVLEHGKK